MYPNFKTHTLCKFFRQEGHHCPQIKGAHMPMYLSFEQLEPECVSSLYNLCRIKEKHLWTTKQDDLLSQMVEDHHVGVHVIEIIRVWRIIIGVPVYGQRTPFCKQMGLCFTLVIYTVKASNLFTW